MKEQKDYLFYYCFDFDKKEIERDIVGEATPVVPWAAPHNIIVNFVYGILDIMGIVLNLICGYFD